MTQISVDHILPNPDQPRKQIDPQELQELADSIRIHGLIQPITVDATGDNHYILNDGERRWLAHKILGRTLIEATVIPPNGHSPDRLVRALVANLQRTDMSYVDTGQAILRLKKERGWTLSQIQKALGKSAPFLDKCLLILRLDPEIQKLVCEGQLPSDPQVLRSFLAIEDSQTRVALAWRLVQRGEKRIQVCVSACQKLAPKKVKDAKKTIPAPRMIKNMPRRWNAMMHLGRVPPWNIFQDAVKNACAKCAWSDTDAHSCICGDCPVVELVKSTLKKVERAP